MKKLFVIAVVVLAEVLCCLADEARECFSLCWSTLPFNALSHRTQHISSRSVIATIPSSTSACSTPATSLRATCTREYPNSGLRRWNRRSSMKFQSRLARAPMHIVRRSQISKRMASATSRSPRFGLTSTLISSS